MKRNNSYLESSINIASSMEVQQRIAYFIKHRDNFFPKTSEIRWLKLLNRLHEKLKICISNEITSGNSLIALHSSDWPDKGSIVAVLKGRFKTTEFDADLFFRALNDAHYCNEELAQVGDHVTHLLIT